MEATGLRLMKSTSADNPEIFFSDYNQIAEGLFIGNDETSRDKAGMKCMNITHILAAGKELEVYHPKDFKYLKL